MSTLLMSVEKVRVRRCESTASEIRSFYGHVVQPDSENGGVRMVKSFDVHHAILLEVLDYAKEPDKIRFYYDNEMKNRLTLVMVNYIHGE
ncbi:hypothetical protein [Xanthomonas phage SB4]|uniref:Uncharacterized protein n=1 Tax=Xanthomonas phage SB4 TaxID=3117473 RepID=A0ABZ2GZL5_9CAUD